MNLPNRSQVLAPIFAFLLVFSAFAGGVGVQPAAATHDCDNLDSLVFFASLTIFNYDKCAQSHVSSDVQEVQELQAEQTELDLYNAALSQRSSAESQAAIFDNYLNDTESAAWMKAEIALAESYQNGDSQSVAESKARQAIADYYAVKQKNLLSSHNTAVKSWLILRDRAENETNVSATYLDIPDDPTHDYDPSLAGNSTVSVTLVNGSTAEELRVDVSSMQGSGQLSMTQGRMFVTVNGNDYHATSSLRVKAPDANHDLVTYMHFGEWHDRWTRIEAQNDALQAEVTAYVNATWESYQAGTINASDVISGHTAMFRYSDQTLDGSGNLYSSIAALSTLGLDTPELNGTGTMELMYNGATYYGLPMARNAPNGSWQANTTYNTSNISGPVFMVTTDGRRIELNGEFTIGTISDISGGTIQQVNTTKVVYKSANTSEFLAMQQEISELRAEVEAKQQAIGDGSSSGSNIDPKYLLGALAVIGLLAYGKGQQSKGN